MISSSNLFSICCSFIGSLRFYFLIIYFYLFSISISTLFSILKTSRFLSLCSGLYYKIVFMLWVYSSALYLGLKGIYVLIFWFYFVCKTSKLSSSTLECIKELVLEVYVHIRLLFETLFPKTLFPIYYLHCSKLPYF